MSIVTPYQLNPSYPSWVGGSYQEGVLDQMREVARAHVAHIATLHATACEIPPRACSHLTFESQVLACFVPSLTFASCDVLLQLNKESIPLLKYVVCVSEAWGLGHLG